MNVDLVFSITGGMADVLISPLAIAQRRSSSEVRQTVEYAPMSSLVSTLSVEDANAWISKMIHQPDPALVARFGSTELRVVLKHHLRSTRDPLEKIYASLARLESPIWIKREHENIRKKSGFYPISEAHINNFVAEMKVAMSGLDLLASWVPGENKLSGYFPHVTVTDISGISPLAVANPWTKALAGKKVLVIHPFKQSITNQYVKRRSLFTDPEFLPDFELTVLQAVQSLGTPPPSFPTWFDGLQYMHELSKKIDFDIALIACGAYGFPLGARIKADGRKAIVLGGILQLLFGIRGKRWDNDNLYNDYWISPSEAEKPDGFLGADGGAYW